MKQVAVLLLTALLALSLVACNDSATVQNQVVFYYQNAELSYNATDSALASETRDGSTYNNLEETLLVYLAGPVESNHISPFPVGLQLVSLRRESNTLYLVFSDELSNLSGLKLTVACCCIAQTCLGLTDAENICISAETVLLGGERSITLNESNMNLLDSTQQAKSE